MENAFNTKRNFKNMKHEYSDSRPFVPPYSLAFFFNCARCAVVFACVVPPLGCWLLCFSALALHTHSSSNKNRGKVVNRTTTPLQHPPYRPFLQHFSPLSTERENEICLDISLHNHKVVNFFIQ